MKELILPGESFLVAGRPAFVLTPPMEKRSTPQPWIFYAPTLPGLPDEAEQWMHEQFLAAGVAVAGIDVGEAYGSPKGRELFTALHRELTARRGFAARPCVLGRSRGGLLGPELGRAITRTRSPAWPGSIRSSTCGVIPGWQGRGPGLRPDRRSSSRRGSAEFNPIERVGELASHGVPALLIHGDGDEVVPLRENSAAFVARYQDAGAARPSRLIVAKGQGHNYWEGFFRCRELVDFAIDRARAGARVSGP